MPNTSFTKQQVKRFREIEKIQLSRGANGLHELFDALIERLEEEYDVEPTATAVPRKNPLDHLTTKIGAWARGKKITQDPYFGDKLIYLSLLVPACIFLLWSVWFLLVGDVPVAKTITMSRTWEVALPFAISRWWDVPVAMIITPALFTGLVKIKEDHYSDAREILDIIIFSFVVAGVALAILGVNLCLFVGGVLALSFRIIVVFTESLGLGVLASVIFFSIFLSIISFGVGILYSLVFGVITFLLAVIIFLVFGSILAACLNK